jgi:hypothetical protein
MGTFLGLLSTPVVCDCVIPVGFFWFVLKEHLCVQQDTYIVLRMFFRRVQTSGPWSSELTPSYGYKVKVR